MNWSIEKNRSIEKKRSIENKTTGGCHVKAAAGLFLRNVFYRNVNSFRSMEPVP